MRWIQFVLIICIMAVLASAKDSVSSTISRVRNLRSLEVEGSIQMPSLPKSTEFLETLRARRQLSSIDEEQKEKCCRSAFELCVPSPNIKRRAWARLQRKILKHSIKACKPLTVVFGSKRVTKRAVCEFFSGHPTNCAMIPQSPKDFERYDAQLKRCCARAPEMCDDMSNPFLLHELKRECHWFAKTTAEDICSMDGGFECSDEWLGR